MFVEFLAEIGGSMLRNAVAVEDRGSHRNQAARPIPRAADQNALLRVGQDPNLIQEIPQFPFALTLEVAVAVRVLIAHLTQRISTAVHMGQPNPEPAEGHGHDRRLQAATGLPVAA